MSKVLVTGADGGIGSAILGTLRSAGHDVIGASRNDTDITDTTDIHRLKERVGQLDWIICAHGFVDTETVLEKQDVAAIEETFAVNATSLVVLAREFLDAITPGGGMIVLSSSAGVTPNGRFVAYSASKAAANAFVQALARNRTELQFYAIAPGPTNTAMRERVAHDAAKMQSPEVIATLVQELIAGSTECKSGDVILVKDGTRSIVSRV
ncbi:SDR family oxidoreductase [Candidatus Parcubacteria bacterium]|nr:MAG: SDR family oxidoreductase [Candidatus Parcubacteria bacterium]